MSEHFIPTIESSPSRRNDTLKVIALVTMLIDHIGAIFFPGEMLWRTIGRVAFPIFSWQLAEGFIHTSSRSKYALRLFLFGCVSQAPYMFLNPDISMAPLHINIMFQLFTGVLLLAAAEAGVKAFRRSREKAFPNIILSLFWLTVCCILVIVPDLLNAWNPDFRFSYGTYGQLMFLIFYFFRSSAAKTVLAYGALSLFHAVEMAALWDINNNSSGIPAVKQLIAFWINPGEVGATALWSLQELPTLSTIYFQARSYAALPLIWIFENRPGKLKLNRWIGYWFYPVHMAILVSLKWVMMQS